MANELGIHASEAGLAELTESLRQSAREQARLLLYVGPAQIGGVVTRVEAGTVELRDGAERILVRLDRVDAVRRA